MPTLITAARQRHDYIGEASHALPWLHLRDRLELFETLLAINPGTDQFGQMASQLSVIRDTRIAAPLWKLTMRGELDAQTIHWIDQALRRAYLGSRVMQNMGTISKAERKRLVTDASPRANQAPNGSDSSRRGCS